MASPPDGSVEHAQTREQLTATDTAEANAERGKGPGLGAKLCWAVVFADIGTSVYYTPGILYGHVGTRAALFVGMTLVVFVLLTVKYAEVAVRYPGGGGVVTVASRALHPFVGLLGGLFILVDYFLTAALSALSGLIYMSVVAPGLKGLVLPLTVAALVALGTLNLVGISASAAVSAVFAVAAASGQLGVVVAVLLHFGPGALTTAVQRMLEGPRLTPVLLLTGYAGAFLAFSGLESIAQLAPAMAEPRRRVAKLAMVLVVVTVVATSPLLTLWSTTLLDARTSDPNQFVSLLGGYAAGVVLQDGVAVTGALLLIFASNTAVIGSYHVFLALSKMRFLPSALQARNRWRSTPHWSIITAIAVPLAVVVAARGNVGVLGDLYAFGLLGAFVVTCVSLDVVRWHERHETPHPDADHPGVGRTRLLLGFLTTFLVAVGWSTNLVAKPLATLFGGGVTVLGLGIALVTYRLTVRRGRPVVHPHLHQPMHPIVLMSRGQRLPPAHLLVLLPRDEDGAIGLVEAVADRVGRRPVAFLYEGDQVGPIRRPQLMEIVDPYLEDINAQSVLSAVAWTAQQRGIKTRFVYIPASSPPGSVEWVVDAMHPEEAVILDGGADLAGHGLEPIAGDTSGPGAVRWYRSASSPAGPGRPVARTNR
jgi:amino acid transporter